MIIKISPENDIEKAKIKEVEHTGVREFLIFGNKTDNDNELIDFHDWSGSYRYLEGSCYYFLGRIRNEQDSQTTKETKINLKAAPPPIPIRTEVAQEQPQQTPFIKKSGSADGEIEGVVEIANSPHDKRPAKQPNLKIAEEPEVEEIEAEEMEMTETTD